MLFVNNISGGQVNTCPVLCEKHVIEETCTLSVDESQLYPECVVTRAMDTKAKGELQTDVTVVQSDTSGDMTLLEAKYSDWCEPLSVNYPITAPCVLPELIKYVDLKLPNGREELILAQTSDTDLGELYNKALSVEEADRLSVCKSWHLDEKAESSRHSCDRRMESVQVYRNIVVPSKY